MGSIGKIAAGDSRPLMTPKKWMNLPQGARGSLQELLKNALKQITHVIWSWFSFAELGRTTKTVSGLLV
jgi:hypothetical protein